MKKIIALIVLCTSILLISILAANIQSDEKVDHNVYKALEKQKAVKVVIELKEEMDKTEQREFDNKITSGSSDKKSEKEISTLILKKDLKMLEKEENVKKIRLVGEKQKSLQDSIKQVRANESHLMQFNGLNLTGKYQTICIIDTGINYTHPALGGCTYKQHGLNGNIIELSEPVQSTHNYQTDTTVIYKINYTGFTKISAHFKNISTEERWDRVEVLNGTNVSIINYSGNNMEDIWTPNVTGDTLYIKLVADESYNYYGFYIDKIINGSTNTTYNWSNCGKVIGGYDFCSGDQYCYNRDEDPMDVDGHGTHVSGIAAANGSLIGIAPESNIIMIKAGNGTGTFWDTELEDAIDWCVNNASLYNISVISMSLGGGLYTDYCNSDDLTDEINRAVAKNISVVVATGNHGSTTQISSPACIQNATPVGAIGKDDSTFDFNRNTLVDLIAPGESINSSVVLSESSTGYASWSGSSMSAPHIAGAIAILRQALNLTGQYKNTTQIESILNSTGKRIQDVGGSELFYSRIDIRQAVLSIDTLSPNLTLLSPENNHVNFNSSHIFSCNASDWELRNISFYLWNSTSLVNLSVFNMTSKYSETNLTIYNLSLETYTWNCRACDSMNNCAFASNNSTLKTWFVNLNSPSNNTYTTTKAQTFNCSAKTEAGKAIKNLTFYLWNSSSVVNSTLFSVSGQENSTNLTINLSEELYYWNCLAKDNESNSTFAEENYSIAYDVTKPNISLISPDNSASYTSNSQEITFSFSVSDNIGISNCSLIISNSVEATNSSINNLTLNYSVKDSFSPGTYTWYINCTDKAGNMNSSINRTFIINSAGSSDTSGGGNNGGGGGGGGDDTQTDNENRTRKDEQQQEQYREYFVTKERMAIGYSRELLQRERIVFNLSSSNESHLLTLTEVNNESANFSVQSEIINVSLRIGEEKMINVTSPEFYDFYVKLENITENKANITIREVNREVSASKARGITGGILVFLVLVIMIIILFANKKRIMKKKKNIKDKKKK